MRTLPEPESLPTYQASERFRRESVLANVWVGHYPRPGPPPHAHDFLEIIVIGSGVGRHYAAHGTVEFGPGHVVVIRPGAWHSFAPATDMVGAWIGLSVPKLSSDLAFLRGRRATRDLLYTGPLAPAARGVWITDIGVSAAREVLRAGRRLQKLLAAGADETLTLGQLLIALGLITREIPSDEPDATTHPAVVSVMGLLHGAPERSWTVTELAGEANLDVAYLSRLFRSETGVSMMSYLARVRTERAAELLVSTSLPMSRIGASVGWPDPTYFARRFQQLSGLKPSEYRRRMRNPEGSQPSETGAVEIGRNRGDLGRS